MVVCLAASGGLLAACSHAHHAHQATSSPPSTAIATTAPATTTTTAPAATTTTTRVSTAPTRGPVDAPQLRDVAGDQAIVVHATGYGQTTATLTTYRRDGSGWRVVAGPWSAQVGRAGIAPPGAKREGDGRTPSGTFGFDFAFGVDPDPGVHLAFRRVTSTDIVWDDDPNSPLYNEWVDRSTQDAGSNPEPMFTRPAYNLGAVIAYNAARTPRVGSAIFLHVSTGKATAGCVSLPAAELRSVLLWLDPSASPAISIGAG